MPAKEVPAQKVLQGHFVFADTPTILRGRFKLPIDPKALSLEYNAFPWNSTPQKHRLNLAFYDKLAAVPGGYDKPQYIIIATPIQRNVPNRLFGLEYAVVNLQMDLMAEDVVARAQAQGWETTWEDETDYCDVNTGAMGRRQVGHVKFIVCDGDGPSLPPRLT